MWSTSTANGENGGASRSIYLLHKAQIGSFVAIALFRAAAHSLLFQVWGRGKAASIFYK